MISPLVAIMRMAISLTMEGERFILKKTTLAGGDISLFKRPGNVINDHDPKVSRDKSRSEGLMEFYQMSSGCLKSDRVEHEIRLYIR